MHGFDAKAQRDELGLISFLRIRAENNRKTPSGKTETLAREPRTAVVHSIAVSYTETIVNDFIDSISGCGDETSSKLRQGVSRPRGSVWERELRATTTRSTTTTTTTIMRDTGTTITRGTTTTIMRDTGTTTTRDTTTTIMRDTGTTTTRDTTHDFSDASMRSLIIALTLISGFMVAEVVGGIISGSLALLADAGHMITDAAAIGLALFALAVSRRRASGDSTFGYRRAEVLATMINVISLWLIAAWLMFEAYHRVVHLGHDHVEPIKVEWMLGVGGLGLIVNILAAWVLHSSSQHNMNVEGAMKHVLADMLGSVGVIVSAVVIYFTGLGHHRSYPDHSDRGHHPD